MNTNVDPGAPTPTAGGDPTPTDPQTTVLTTPADPAAAPPADPTAPAVVGDDFAIEMPDGVELDADAMTEFRTLAKEQKLNVEQAKALGEVAIKMAQRQADAHKAMVQSWRDEVENDPTLGQAKLETTLATARRALALAPPELKEFLNTSGMGNHPGLLRWAYAVGQKLAPDTLEKGTPAPPEKSLAETLYPSMTKR